MQRNDDAIAPSVGRMPVADPESASAVRQIAAVRRHRAPSCD